MFSHMRVLRFGLKTHIFYLNTQPNVCILSHIWSKVLYFFSFFFKEFLPQFSRCVRFTHVFTRGMKQNLAFLFYGRMGTLSCYRIDNIHFEALLRTTSLLHIHFLLRAILSLLFLCCPNFCGHHTQVAALNQLV